MSASSVKKISWDEICKHASADDGWVVIHGKVYDVTRYAAGHPGGPQWILDWLGRDATAQYDVKGGMGVGHSDFAKSELEKLLVGEVEGA